MRRRDLLVGSAGAGSMALGGCVVPEARPLVVQPTAAESQAIEDRWRAVEAVKEAIAARPRPALDDVLDRGRSRGKRSLADDLGRKAARSLLVSGAFRDLPEDARTHPFVQRGMRSALPEMDDAVFGIQRRLDALTPTERADIARELRRDPELGQRVLRILDVEASEVGASDARRLHMRQLGLTVCDRLHHSAEQLLGEYRDKMQKVVARHGSDAELEQRLAASLGREAFAAMKERTLASHARHRTLVVAQAGRGWSPQYGPDPQESDWTSADTVLTVGAVLLGLSAVFGITGGVLIAAGSFVGAIFLTAGALHLLGGLIVLIVGAVMKANEE